MKKTGIIIIVLLVLGAGAVAAVLSMQPKGGTENNSQQSGGSNTSNEQPNQPQEEQSSEPVSNVNEVEIKDFAFSPSTITVKKGTTVTWTNQDDMGHNVIAAEESSTGGLPTTHALLKKGEKFSHTFNEVGTFNYRCEPHPNMTGIVEVTE